MFIFAPFAKYIFPYYIIWSAPVYLSLRSSACCRLIPSVHWLFLRRWVLLQLRQCSPWTLNNSTPVLLKKQFKSQSIIFKTYIPFSEYLIFFPWDFFFYTQDSPHPPIPREPWGGHTIKGKIQWELTQIEYFTDGWQSVSDWIGFSLTGLELSWPEHRTEAV